MRWMSRHAQPGEGQGAAAQPHGTTAHARTMRPSVRGKLLELVAAPVVTVRN